MKKSTVRIIALVLAMLTCLGCGCGKVFYTCGKCNKTTMDAYYDPFDSDRFFCEDCAREYFAPFPYKNYSVD